MVYAGGVVRRNCHVAMGLIVSLREAREEAIRRGAAIDRGTLMDTDSITQAAGALECTCGRVLQTGAVYCDACGQAVAYTDMTVHLPAAPATGVTTRLLQPALFTDMSEDTARLQAAIREGMSVSSAEGKRLGKVFRVVVREQELYLHVVSRVDVWQWWRFDDAGLYLPRSAIAEVDAKHVRLRIDATTAQGCTSRPSWIAPLRSPEQLTFTKGK
jgi:hypothetical protein